MDRRFNIEKVKISIIHLEEAVLRIMDRAKSRIPGYVCVTNVRATYIGNRDPKYCSILNQSFLTVPDGKPIEWYAKISGFKDVKKTSGPDLFNRICDETENTSFTHFFFGSSMDILEKMLANIKNKWPGLKIAGAISPPFKPVEELATDEIIKTINHHKPNFVWVGLGAPKQEFFMKLIMDRIENSILIGIGLVFDYEAGSVKRAPLWMQKSGLEWTYRLTQQPQNIKRAKAPFFWIIIKILKQLFFNGKKESDYQAMV